MRQLTALDAQFLAMETARTYGHVGGLATFDPSTAPGGKLELADLCRMVSERIHLLPPFRWKLAEVPFRLDHPYWIEDTDFDVDFHIRESAIPPPGDDQQLSETVARIFARPLDRRRPLWELYLIHGLPEGRVAMLTKIHHSAVDGLSGAEILGVIMDLSPEGREIPPPEEGARGRLFPPSQIEMLGRGIAGLPLQPLRAARSLPSTLPALTKFPGLGLIPGAPTAERAFRKLAPNQDGGILEQNAIRAPRVPFSGRISPHRRFSFGTLSLERVKALKNELGITVNDVVVGLCTSAVRDWLIARDALPAEPLIALVPVSVRTDEEQGTFGNKVSGMILPIPTDVADPRERLMRAHEILRSAKDRHKALPASLMTDASNFIPPALHSRAARVTMEIMGRVRPPLNLVISNVPGPPIPLYCAGAQLQHHYPVSVITDGVGLNITLLSYRDGIDFGIIADRELVDDVWEMAEGLKQNLADLDDLICGKKKAGRRERRPAPTSS